MKPLEDLLAELKATCAGLEDKRRGQDCRYRMADIGLAAFSVLVTQSPSFLAHRRALKEGYGRSNCETLLESIGTDASDDTEPLHQVTIPPDFLALVAFRRICVKSNFDLHYQGRGFLTGFRQEVPLIIRPIKRWPLGPIGGPFPADGHPTVVSLQPKSPKKGDV